MSLYMSLDFNPTRGRAVKVGTIAKEQFDKLKYNRSIEDLLGQTDRDYFHLSKPKNTVKPEATKMTTFAEGLKNFFERGTTF